MSQDNQNSQPPSSLEPQETQPGQRTYQKVQPFWKIKTIQILKAAIAVLESTVEKLETEPPPSNVETRHGASLLLAKIRSFLPANLSAKLSDTALTGIIAVFAVILVWTTSTVLTSKPTEIATAPPPPTPSISPTPEAPPAEEPPPPSVTTPPEETLPPIAEEPTPPPQEEPEPKPEITPTPTPTPTFVFTPEQTLIATIENQVAEISDRFASGLIQSIQANFLTSSLNIKISDDWYTLEESQQDKLAAEILQRSQELDFTHLEITDSQNRLVARNPVVGTEMVIFKRRA
ncbi:MAG: hypothetical protein N2235_26155 [Fischerella sp.]|nr:hypothetical protein [Fischerella sp.]